MAETITLTKRFTEAKKSLLSKDYTSDNFKKLSDKKTPEDEKKFKALEKEAKKVGQYLSDLKKKYKLKGRSGSKPQVAIEQGLVISYFDFDLKGSPCYSLRLTRGNAGAEFDILKIKDPLVTIKITSSTKQKEIEDSLKEFIAKYSN